MIVSGERGRGVARGDYGLLHRTEGRYNDGQETLTDSMC